MEQYTPEKKGWVLEQVRALIAQKGSQAKASKLLGMSDALISQLLNDKYKGQADSKLADLYGYFTVKAEAAKTYGALDYAPTSISGGVYDIIRNCQLQGGMAIAAGDAGIGKTKAAKQFERDYPASALYIQMNPCISCVKPMLRVICARLGVSKKTIDEMWQAAVDKLRDGMVLIVDEAQHLPIKSIETLRSFADYFSDKGQTLGIALIGNTETVYRFGGKKEADFAQIANRTKQKKVYYANQVQKGDMEMLFPELEGRNMELELLLGIARSPQAIRGAVNLYGNAYDNEDISYDGLLAMARHMELQI